MEIRPRTTGEILDDAWRLALADAPLLLLYTALFLVPVFTILLLLLAVPAPAGFAQIALPIAAMLVLPLTGLASGACQELFRRRIAGETVSLRDGVMPALRYGLEHLAARAALLSVTLAGPVIVLCSLHPSTSAVFKVLGFLFGCVLTLVLSLPIWAANTSLHALIAEGRARTGTLFRELRGDAAAAALKAAAVVACRLPLLLLLAVQLHLLALSILWVADNLAGLDTALLSAELTFGSNPVYTMALFLLSWLLLTPFFEAGNFLLHTDVRTRREGLDLQFRVQRVFSALARINEDKFNRQDAKDAKKKTERRAKSESALSFLFLFLGVLGVLAVNPQSRADEEQREAVREVRRGIETIRAEVKTAEPYPGGQRWVGRLRELGEKLADAGEGDAKRLRWYDKAIADFGERKREDALRVLDDLHRRVSLLEDALAAPPRDGAEKGRSPKEVKSLLRGTEVRKHERPRRQQRIEDDRKEIKRVEVRREDAKGEDHQNPADGGGGGGGGGGGSGARMPSVSSGGFSFLGWVLLAGLGLAILAAALYLFLSSRRGARTPKPSAVMGKEALPPENEAKQVLEESPSELWRQADKLAGDGRFREAVRILYLAVLALLHRQQFIRFEATRTNGEYVRQVHLSEIAPPELHEPFHELTDLFEAKWYGERACESADYRACHKLAEEIQNQSAVRSS
ncbi:MAG TPA: DUF4129 domain-containing protein [Gemmataceae bacterium]